MPNNIIPFNGKMIKGKIKEMVRSSVEKALTYCDFPERELGADAGVCTAASCWKPGWGSKKYRHMQRLEGMKTEPRTEPRLYIL